MNRRFDNENEGGGGIKKPQRQRSTGATVGQSSCPLATTDTDCTTAAAAAPPDRVTNRELLLLLQRRTEGHRLNGFRGLSLTQDYLFIVILLDKTVSVG